MISLRTFFAAGAVGLGLAVAGPAHAIEDLYEPVEFAIPSDLADNTLLLDVDIANGRLVAVGEYGHIVYSDDGGETWTQAARVPTQITLTSVDFVDDKVGYAAGHDTIILKTEDGGENWYLLYTDPEAETPILTMQFSTPERGLVMGAFSFVMETRDGGQTWNVRPIVSEEDSLSELDYHLNEVFQGANGDIFVAAEFGVVYRSRDGGTTFEPIQTPYEGSFWGGLGVRDGSILVFGMRGNIFRSTDGGDTWSRVPSGVNKSFGGGWQLDDGTVVLAGLNGAVAYSTDNGASFTTLTRPDRMGYAAVAPAADNQIALFGEPGVKLQPSGLEEAREALDAGS